MGVFERFLSLWVALAILIGIVSGQLLPGVFGALAGLLGGLVSLWLPAVLVYLSARQVTKEEFVRATGLLLFSGSIPLVAGFWREGFLTGPLATVSAGMLLPTLFGMFIGSRLRHRLSERAFRRVLMGVLVLIGLNLIRRSFTG